MKGGESEKEIEGESNIVVIPGVANRLNQVRFFMYKKTPTPASALKGTQLKMRRRKEREEGRNEMARSSISGGEKRANFFKLNF